MSISRMAKRFENAIKNAHKEDSSIVLEEHDVKPVSYMAFSNLRNIIHDSSELLSLMNEEDQLPAWASESLAIAKNNVSKILGYVRSEKSSDEEEHEHHYDHGHEYDLEDSEENEEDDEEEDDEEEDDEEDNDDLSDLLNE